MKRLSWILLMQLAGGLSLFGQVIPLESGLTLRKQVEVPAASGEIWERFTTQKGIESFFAPEARVDLAVNGVYEIYCYSEGKKGERGSEGCRILSFIPGELLSFTWDNPPRFPSLRGQFSWVVLTFTPIAQDRTRVDLVHLGFRADPEWSEALKYFDRFWNVVLSRLVYSFSAGPMDWKKPYNPE